jgi:hypothetical protein
MIGCFHIQSDFLSLVSAGKSGDLGSIERCDMRDDSIDTLQLEVDIVNTKVIVKPSYLGVDEGFGYPASCRDFCLDYLLLALEIELCTK